MKNHSGALYLPPSVRTPERFPREKKEERSSFFFKTNETDLPTLPYIQRKRESKKEREVHAHIGQENSPRYQAL